MRKYGKSFRRPGSKVNSKMFNTSLLKVLLAIMHFIYQLQTICSGITRDEAMLHKGRRSIGCIIRLTCIIPTTFTHTPLI